MYFGFRKISMENKSINRPRIMVCPLDWGIGHATRCIPIIRLLIKKGAEVIIAADQRPMLLLQQEFPGLSFIRFPGYRFSYPESGRMAWKMAVQTPAIIKGIRQEHQKLQELIDQYKIDAVISDNRFGLYSQKKPSVFMTHQVFIQTPWYLRFIRPVLNVMNWRYISRFDECWIPDVEGEENLSGMLSHTSELPDQFHFIGPQSRLSCDDIAATTKYDIFAILSGPEPQRTILEEKLMPMLAASGLKCAMALGTPEKEAVEFSTDHIHVFTHPGSEEMRQLIMQSEWIISRPGYSTIMDLAVLGKKAIFIPTPGQTEQEYLASYFREKGIFYTEKQSEFDLSRALKNAGSYKGLVFNFNQSALERVVDRFLNRVQRR